MRTFAVRAEDALSASIFSSYREGPDAFTIADLDPRSVLVFSDQHGRPYQPYVDPPLVNAPRPHVNIVSGSNTLFDALLPPHGVIVLAGGSESRPVTITVLGEHIRTGLHPHGMLDEHVQAWLEPWSFRRIRTINLGRWFPKNPLPQNIFARYSEKNELVPLADGRAAFRAMYRAYRETYRDESYDSDDHIPAGTPVDGTGSQIYVTNFAVAPDSALLGRRALNDAPRTQEQEVEQNPLDTAALIPMAPQKPADTEQRRFWFVGKLPPGACIELQPIATGTTFFGDDPRVPGNDRGADLYGITVTEAEDVVSVFANGDGDFFLPVHFPTNNDFEAEVRVITWTTAWGKEVKQVRSFALKMPVPDLTAPPAGAWPPPQGFSLSDRGNGNGATLTIQGGGPLPVGTRFAVVNQRSGAIVVHEKTAAGDVEVALPDFGSRDVALVGVLPAGGSHPATCAKLYAVTISNEQLASGFIPAHPRQLLGVLRQAIGANVDVRHLAYRDQMKNAAADVGGDPQAEAEDPGGTAAMMAALNALIGQRGEAIADPLLRPTNSHHQKTSFIHSPKGVSALIGGVDHVPSRFDFGPHDAVEPDRPTSVLWHDVHCYVRGKAAWDVFYNFKQRWNAAILDETVQSGGVNYTSIDDNPDPNVTTEEGTHAVQITRTLPPGIAPYSGFTDLLDGEVTVQASYVRTIDTARQFLYIEDQYFWNLKLAAQINQRLRAPQDPLGFVIVVLPKQLAEKAVIDLVLYAMRVRAVNTLLYGQAVIPPGTDVTTLPGNVSDRVLIVHPVNGEGRPIYVHCKMMIADDLWMTIGSSNLNNRSMTYDTELNAASIDYRVRRGAHRTAHEMRVSLMAEHLGLDELERPMVEDPAEAFRLFRAAVSGTAPDWMKERASTGQHLVAFDPTHTHSGVQPEASNQVFVDLVQMALDPIGSNMNLTVHMQQVVGLLNALSAVPDGSTAVFGGLGALRVQFTFPQGMAVDRVELELLHNSQQLVAGSFPPDQIASVGIFSAGASILITARAFNAADMQVGSTQLSAVPSAAFVTDVTIPF